MLGGKSLPVELLKLPVSIELLLFCLASTHDEAGINLFPSEFFSRRR